MKYIRDNFINLTKTKDLKHRLFFGFLFGTIAVLIMASGYAKPMIWLIGLGILIECSNMFVSKNKKELLKNKITPKFFGINKQIRKLPLEKRIALNKLRTKLSFIKLISILTIAFSIVYMIRMFNYDYTTGIAALLFILSITIGTDCGAYFIGMSVRGKKLSPKISPNKSIAGAVGGLFFGTTGGIIFAILLNMFCNKIPTFSTAEIVLIPIIASVLSQIGDLSESYVKRLCEVKDASQLIPGHGGLWDRLDGFVPASIFINIYIHGMLLSHGLLN